MASTSDSSSEDDNVYISSASRLKALKKKPPVSLNEESPTISLDNEFDFWSQSTTEPSSGSTTGYNTRISSQVSQRTSRGSRADSQAAKITTVEVVIDDDEPAVLDDAKDTLNISQDPTIVIEDDNYNIDVKVKWKSRELVRLELKKHEAFQKIFQHFANLEGVSEKQILILKENKTVQRTDTPASLNLKVIDILEGGIVNADMMTEETPEDAENICKIKVQMSTKQKINVDIKMDETFDRVLITCAKELGVESSRIKLSFDGDEISPTDTPESLDLEQEACIDLRVVR